MTFLWGAFSSSSSSSSPSSPFDSLQKFKNRRNFFGWPWKKGRQSWQQKSKYENGVRSQSVPVSPESAWVSSNHWSRSAVPQPLPVPGQYFRDNTTSLDPPNTRNEGISDHQDRGFIQGLNGKSIRSEFRLNVPTRSAPGSGFSSPVVSPKRFSTGDLFRSSDQASTLNAARLDRVPWATDSPDSYNYAPVHDTNDTNRHQLPLPPKVSRSLLSSNIHHHIDKSETPKVKSQWRKGKLIGRGTYGSVYLATHCETGALCAMKEVDFFPDDPKTAECIMQLEQEMKFLQQLNHPNVVQYYGSEIIGESFCIYLEYVHPGSIDKYVREQRRAMNESIVCHFTYHILRGLAYLHSVKTIHRDIKGANLLVNSDGIVKLADFGLAKHITKDATNLSLKGSPHWMAPEVLQAVMRNDANPELACAVDIWGLGCTVIEMLTGKPPWSELNGVQAMFNVLKKTPPIPETLSLEGKDFLHQCLQRDPAARPSAIKLLAHPFLQNVTILDEELVA